MHQFKNHFLAHERLAIMDPASGDQPLFNEDKTIAVTVNGEIYNYRELKKKILEKCPGKKFATGSDCEVGTPGQQSDNRLSLPQSLQAAQLPGAGDSETGSATGCIWDQ